MRVFFVVFLLSLTTAIWAEEEFSRVDFRLAEPKIDGGTGDLVGKAKKAKPTPTSHPKVERPRVEVVRIVRVSSPPHPRQYRHASDAVASQIRVHDLPSASRLDAQDARQRNLTASTAKKGRDTVRDEAEKTREAIARLAQEERQRAMLFLLLAASLFFFFACWVRSR